MISHSIYLHIPFCRHLCSYCDFNTYAGLDDLIPAYIDALCTELDFVAGYHVQKLPVHTIFIGGGTPSILPIHELEKIFHKLDRVFDLGSGVEVTMEANPGRLNYRYLKSLRDLGINRLSIGMQSAVPEELRLLERQHDNNRTEEAVNDARKAGFGNINLDLIFGIPDQSLLSWQKSLDLALSFQPDHFSLYSLSIEPGTPLNDRLGEGLISEPDPDLAAEMYELAATRLHDLDFEQYEISNWARKVDGPGLMSCQHNLQYWRNLPYLGFGAGAHGYSGDKRTVNVRKPLRYIEKLKKRSQDEISFPSSPATSRVAVISQAEQIKETMMMGLRLTDEGISRRDFYTRFGTSLEEVYGDEIEELLGLGLLEWDQASAGRLRLTPKGRLLGNLVFQRFI
jgi:oxygen-independent coproporphyrinogen-3 oxidase